MVRRGEAPYAGRWALPGGFVRAGRGPRRGRAAELAEETGLTAARRRTSSSWPATAHPDRDPRMRVVTVAYLALAPDLPHRAPARDARTRAGCRWPTADDARLAFDHDRSCATASSGPARSSSTPRWRRAFCPPEFTVAELRRVYEIVWGTGWTRATSTARSPAPRDFSRPPANDHPGRRPPAQLYRRGELRILHPPMTRATE